MLKICFSREHEAQPTVVAIQNLESNDLQPVDRLAQSFCSLHKLKKVMAWLLRFCAYLTHKHCKETPWPAGPLTFSELDNVEKVLVAYKQRNFCQLFIYL